MECKINGLSVFIIYFFISFFFTHFFELLYENYANEVYGNEIKPIDENDPWEVVQKASEISYNKRLQVLKIIVITFISSICIFVTIKYSLIRGYAVWVPLFAITIIFVLSTSSLIYLLSEVRYQFLILGAILVQFLVIVFRFLVGVGVITSEKLGKIVKIRNSLGVVLLGFVLVIWDKTGYDILLLSLCMLYYTIIWLGVSVFLDKPIETYKNKVYSISQIR